MGLASGPRSRDESSGGFVWRVATRYCLRRSRNDLPNVLGDVTMFEAKHRCQLATRAAFPWPAWVTRTVEPLPPRLQPRSGLSLATSNVGRKNTRSWLDPAVPCLCPATNTTAWNSRW